MENIRFAPQQCIDYINNFLNNPEDLIFEYSSEEDDNDNLLRLEIFHHKSIQQLRYEENIIESLKELIKIMEKKVERTLKNDYQAIQNSIQILHTMKLKELQSPNMTSEKRDEIEKKYINMKCEWKNQKNEIRIKQLKYQLKGNEAEKYEEILNQMNKMNKSIGKLEITVGKKLDDKTKHIKKINSELTGTNEKLNWIYSSIQANQQETTKSLTTISTNQTSFGYNESSQKVIEEVERWTSMKVIETVFDSDVHDWDVETSVFGKKIFNRKNILILIDTSTNVIIGQFISHPIDKKTKSELFSLSQSIDDRDSFVFSNKDGIMTRYFHKKDKSQALNLWPDDDDILFEIGYNCVFIYKHTKSSQSRCNDSVFNTYDFKGNADVLVGNTKQFDIRRLMVYQLN